MANNIRIIVENGGIITRDETSLVNAVQAALVGRAFVVVTIAHALDDYPQTMIQQLTQAFDARRVDTGRFSTNFNVFPKTPAL